VSSSITLQDDDHLKFTAAANEVWALKIIFVFADASNGTADMRIAFTFPSGSLALGAVFPDAGGTLGIKVWTVSGTLQTFGGTSADRCVLIHGTWLVAGTGGDLQLQWCQDTSSASAVTVKKGSAILGMKLA
jgi:hypothetical protein